MAVILSFEDVFDCEDAVNHGDLSKMSKVLFFRNDSSVTELYPILSQHYRFVKISICGEKGGLNLRFQNTVFPLALGDLSVFKGGNTVTVQFSVQKLPLVNFTVKIG